MEEAGQLDQRPSDAAPAPRAVGQADDSAARARAEESARRDRAWVEQALGGDHDAFNALVIEYQDYLFAVCYRVVGDRDRAADAAQEAFLNAYRNLDRFQGNAFRAWLTRIAVNAATDILRDRKRRPADPYPEWEDDSWQPPTGEADDPEHQVTRRARSRVLAQALAGITPDQRAAIVLFDVQGYDYQEIADMTGVELGTVKSRIHRGRMALRSLLADEMELFR